MATCTIVVTTGTPNTGDIIARTTDAPSYVVYIPNSARQTKQLVQKLESVIMSVLSLTN